MNTNNNREKKHESIRDRFENIVELVGKDILYQKDNVAFFSLYYVVKVSTLFTYVLKYECDDILVIDRNIDRSCFTNEVIYKHYTDTKEGTLIKFKNIDLYENYKLYDSGNDIYTKETSIWNGKTVEIMENYEWSDFRNNPRY